MKIIWKSFIGLIIVGLVLLTSCAKEGSPTPNQPAELIPPTTKVIDATARAALENVTATGLTFSGKSAPKNLAVGDVLVTGPTPAAPYGLLRKVKDINISADPDDGGEITVTTEPAKLVDAIHEGSLSIKQELRPENIKSVLALQSGITTQAFNLSIDTDFGSGDKVRVTGSVNVTPILELDLDISCNKKALGVCAEIPDLNLRTRVGIDERSTLRLRGSAAYTFDKEIPLASYGFNPITFSIAAVPVVFVPKLTLYLRSDGSLSATLQAQVTQNATLAVGFEYNSDTGFKDLSERTASYVRDGPTFTGKAEARAVVGVRFEVLLYGVVGPYGSLELGPRVQADVMTFGPNNLLWELEGCLYLNIGIRIDIFTYEENYEKELYRACNGIAQQENRAPIVTILSPNGSSQIYRGVTFSVSGTAFDPDGTDFSCGWSSSVASDAFLTTADSCNASITFATAGPRTLTLAAQDDAGAQGTQSITVTVQEPPVILVEITTPSDGSSIRPENEIKLSGIATGGSGDYTYTWKVATFERIGRPPFNLKDIYTIGSGASLSWIPQDTLPITECDVDFRVQLMLEVTDSVGTFSRRDIQLRVIRIC